MQSLQDLVKKALAAKNLSVAGGAKAAGISYQSFAAVAKGESLPNARSLDKYATLLGMDSSKLQAIIDKEKNMTGKPGPGRPKKAAGAKKPAAKKTTVKKPAAKKTTAKKTTAKKTVAAKPAKKTVAAKPVAAGATVNKGAIRSLESSLKQLDALKAKIDSALKKLQ